MLALKAQPDCLCPVLKVEVILSLNAYIYEAIKKVDGKLYPKENELQDCLLFGQISVNLP